MNRLILWLIALAAPCSVLSFEGPITLTPIRVVAAGAGYIAFLQWLHNRRARVTKGELIFFVISLTFCTISILRSSAYSGQAHFFARSVALFALVYIGTSQYARSDSWGKNELSDLLIKTGMIFALAGIIDWIYGFITGQGLWNVLLNYRDGGGLGCYMRVGYLHVPRATGLFYDPNLFAYYLSIPVLLVLVRVLNKGEPSNKARGTFTLFVLLTAIALSLSRSGIGLLLVATCVLCVRWRRLWWSTAMFVLGSFLLWDLMFSSSGLGTEINTVIRKRLVYEEQGSSFLGSYRLIRMKGGLEAFESNPLFGVGIGGLGLYLPGDIPNEEIITSHNFYVDVLAGTGLLGFSFLVLGLIIYFRPLWERAKGSEESYAALVGVFLILAVQMVYQNMLNPVFAFQIAAVSSLVGKNEVQVYHFRRPRRNPDSYRVCEECNDA